MRRIKLEQAKILKGWVNSIDKSEKTGTGSIIQYDDKIFSDLVAKNKEVYKTAHYRLMDQ